MNAPKTPSRHTRAGEGSDLNRCYGKIGISAVAAAVRYQAEPRSNEHPGVVPQETD